jgi:hypothetical protein
VGTLPILFRRRAARRGWPGDGGALCHGPAHDRGRGVNILILSDRGVNRELAADPALLAVAACTII